jgi:hypothetical protein
LHSRRPAFSGAAERTCLCHVGGSRPTPFSMTAGDRRMARVRQPADLDRRQGTVLVWGLGSSQCGVRAIGPGLPTDAEPSRATSPRDGGRVVCVAGNAAAATFRHEDPSHTRPTLSVHFPCTSFISAELRPPRPYTPCCGYLQGFRARSRASVDARTALNLPWQGSGRRFESDRGLCD